MGGGALYTVYSSIYRVFVHILDTLHEYLLSNYYMLCIQFPPLQGGGHRFKSCTAHQEKSKPPAPRVVFFVLYIHNNLKNNKKRKYSNVLPFCIHRGRPFAEQHRHTVGMGAGPCPLSGPAGRRRIRPARCYAVRDVRAGPRSPAA